MKSFTSLYAQLKDHELLNFAAKAAAKEKEATLALLEYLVEIDIRMLYATKAYSSLFEYIVRELGMSEPATAERVNTIRLMRAVPEVKAHLEAGRLSLTTAAQIQRFIKTEEKVSVEKLNSSEKIAVIDACLGSSKREVEKTLLGKQSEAAKVNTSEKIKTITSDRAELKFTVHENTLQKIEQIKALIGESSLESLFDHGLDLLIAREEKKRGREKAGQNFSNNQILNSVVDSAIEQDKNKNENKTQPAELTEKQKNSRFIPIELKRFVFARSKGRCEFVEARTGNRCQSGFRLQIDHIFPFALGGKTEASNLRHYCAAHNRRAAVNFELNKSFGRNCRSATKH
jgi:hypothetical protein